MTTDPLHKDTDTAAQFAIQPVELVEVMDEFSKLLTKIERYNPHVDKELIKRALRFAAIAHAGQYRRSGKPFIYHGIQTAGILADLHLDSVMIACGILHDIVEDTNVTVDSVREEFGEEIANIIAGLTKIASLHLQSPEERQAENFRKMFLYTARDVRTVIVKFADRLHNMRTLRFLPAAKRRQIAHETLEVFAPLAHRFGIYTIKRELEDLSFRWLYPKEYREVKKETMRYMAERDQYIQRFIDPVEARLAEEKIEHQIQWRIKHYYSIYRKMIRDNKTVEDIYDIFAIRIIVNSIADCYHTLGVIHSMFMPVLDRIKDFIATPKFNMYQSLHTTVIGTSGRMVEVQIRTSEMHQTAETGIAAHWRYKEGKVEEDEIDTYMIWLRKMVDWQSDTPEAKEFLHELKMDLFQDEIFVFTPKGDLLRLPAGATALDFAFALHTEIGLHCTGTKVNGKIVPIDTPLKTGEWIEVLTNANKKPSRNWLNFVKTAKARSLVRRWIKRQHFDESRTLGLDMLMKLEKTLGRKLTDKDKEQLVEKYHQRDWDHFVTGLGSGDVSLHSLQNYFDLTEKKKKERIQTPAANMDVSIQGMENLLVSFAKCCKPLPGDDIVGFVTRGRGVIVHRSDCENVLSLGDDSERAIQVDWQTAGDDSFVASIRVEGQNRHNLLHDITAAFDKAKCDVRSANITTQDDIAVDDFDVNVRSLADLQNLMDLIRRVKGVSRVTRLNMRNPKHDSSDT